METKSSLTAEDSFVSTSDGGVKGGYDTFSSQSLDLRFNGSYVYMYKFITVVYLCKISVGVQSTFVLQYILGVTTNDGEEDTGDKFEVRGYQVLTRNVFLFIQPLHCG